MDLEAWVILLLLYKLFWAFQHCYTISFGVNKFLHCAGTSDTSVAAAGIAADPGLIHLERLLIEYCQQLTTEAPIFSN